MDDGTRENVERCSDVLKEALGSGQKVYTLTTYGRGETDHVRLFIAPRRGEITEITFYAARAAYGPKARLKSGFGLAFRGGQYSKGLEFAEMAFKAAGLPFDQKNWGEL